ncbi:MAG: glycosyltransferase [Methylacidiphilales bacterium]|nr:glycosyltransferase [Candidatus Methylacidiphilales bacterium]
MAPDSDYPSPVVKFIRSWLMRFLLRGPVQRWWLARKGQAFSEQYTRSLLEASRILMDKKPAPAPPLRRMGAPVPSSIVFIADITWEDYYLIPELEKICPVHSLNLHPHIKDASFAEQRRQIVPVLRDYVDRIKNVDPSLVFLYLKPQFLSEEIFQIIRRQFSCPLVGLSLDDQTHFIDYHLFAEQNYGHWARFFDINLTNGHKTLDWYYSRQLPVYYMPQGVRRFDNLDIPKSIDEFRHEMTFLGAMKAERKQLIDDLAARGVSVTCFGSGWPNSRWVDDANSVFRSSMINLGMGTSVPMSRLTCTKGRDFECPGVGSCYLTQFNWELVQHYELGKEILCYSSLEELVEIYSYYRSRPGECLKIAQAAWRRSIACHTWEKRFRNFFAWLA